MGLAGLQWGGWWPSERSSPRRQDRAAGGNRGSVIALVAVDDDTPSSNPSPRPWWPPARNDTQSPSLLPRRPGAQWRLRRWASALAGDTPAPLRLRPRARGRDARAAGEPARTSPVGRVSAPEGVLPIRRHPVDEERLVQPSGADPPGADDRFGDAGRRQPPVAIAPRGRLLDRGRRRDHSGNSATAVPVIASFSTARTAYTPP